jgi:methionine-rich copper-binding protein CopC
MKLNWIALGLLISMVIGPAANAHEQLIDQSPASGSQVQAGPVEIRLDFSNELLDLGSGAEIVVKGPDGEFAPATCVALERTTATSQLDLDLPGSYQVAWRVVSGDGHPIEGSFAFELVNDSGYVAQGVAEPCLISQNQTEPAPEFSYWLLFGSLGLMAAGLFFYLRPRKKDSGQ